MGLETDSAKGNTATINDNINTYAFPTMTCQHIFYEKNS